MNIFVICTLFFGFCSFFFGAIIFFRRKDLKAVLWFLFNLCCGIWALGYAYQINNDVAYDTALIMTRIGDAAAIFIPIFWLHFVAIYLNLSLSQTLLKWLYALSGLIFITSPTTYFVHSLQDQSHLGVSHFVKGGVFFNIFGALFAGVVFYGFLLLIKALRDPRKNKHHQQILFLLLATTIGFTGGSMAFLPVYGVEVPVLFGTLLSPFFTVFIAFAFAKYHFLDFEMLAEAAHQDKLTTMGILSASINHELKTPLYVIQNRADIFLDKEKAGAYQDWDATRKAAIENLSITKAQAEKAFKIIHRLTSFVRRKNYEAITFDDVNLIHVIDDLKPILQYSLSIGNIELVQALAPDALCVKSDRGILEEILFNLLVNAVQALKTKSAEGQIIVRSKKTGSKIQIEIEDNGPGISQEDLKKIFKPFYTTKEQGVGLGLYITSRLAERLGAKLSAKHAPSGGAIFIMEFKS